MLEDPTDPLTVNCILFSHLACPGTDIGVSVPLISELPSLLAKGFLSVEFNELVVSFLPELLVV